jgi:hypothetical protein
MFTLQRIILGTENFDEMWDTNRVLGPFFFCLWVIVGYFVLSNMFVAILVESISNDKVRAIPHIGVADSARSAYSRWQIWQAKTEETKKEQDAKVGSCPPTPVLRGVEADWATCTLNPTPVLRGVEADWATFTLNPKPVLRGVEADWATCTLNPKPVLRGVEADWATCTLNPKPALRGVEADWATCVRDYWFGLAVFCCLKILNRL